MEGFVTKAKIAKSRLTRLTRVVESRPPHEVASLRAMLTQLEEAYAELDATISDIVKTCAGADQDKYLEEQDAYFNKYDEACRTLRQLLNAIPVPTAAPLQHHPWG